MTMWFRLPGAAVRAPAVFALAWGACVLPAGSPLAGQEGTVVTAGSVVERIGAASNGSHAYALFVPTRYEASRPWPLLLVLDPDGRAVEALAAFVPAAERFGWIVMSAHRSLEGLDGLAVTTGAFNAMLSDAISSLHVDERRLYVAGLSGTARLAWQFAAQLPGSVAGIYGTGAGGSAVTRDLDPPASLSFFGAAGQEDFNYEELVAFEPWLRERGVSYRLRIFDGGHEWPPEEVATEALGWFELQAAREGLRAEDPALAASLMSDDLAAAAALEDDGRPADALGRYREVARDFAPSDGTAEARGAADRLAADPDVRETLDERRYRSLVFDDFTARVETWILDLRESREPTLAASGVRLLDVDRMQARAAGDDPEDAAAARRQLEWLRVRLAEYEAPSFLRRLEAERALVVLDVAAAIGPEGPDALLVRARAHLQAGSDEEALAALERAVERGASVSGDDDRFRRLRGHPRFVALVSGTDRAGGGR